jgi:hypothetical protein
MRILKCLLWVVLGLSLFGVLSADDITQRRAEATIRFLADDLLEGRGTPSRGLDIAALYLAAELRSAGWQPAAGGSYFQTYTLKSFTPESTKTSISINGVPLDPKEFTFLPFSMNPELTPVKYDLVFAGYGIFAPEKNVDDFAGADVKGKAVVSLFGAPWPLDPAVVHAYDRGVGKGVHVTVRGGKLLVYVSEEFEAPDEAPPSAEVGVVRGYSKLPLAYLPEFQGKLTSGICPSLAIIPSAFDKTLAKVTGGTYADWKKRLPTKTFKAQTLSASVEVRIETKPQEGKACNVVAMLPGTDSSLKDEWVVLSAHYDHLGFYNTPPGQDGIYNGADDNASGTAAILEMARRLAEARPRRSLLVVLTSGEEQGLLGSAVYSVHPLVPKANLVVNINADMVGRSAGKVFGGAIGCEEILSRAAEFGKQHGIEVLPDPNPTWRLIYFVDSYHFARSNIPYVDFMTEFHEDYHQPSDEAGRIHFKELSQIIDVLSELANFYAQGGEKPVFKRPAWFLIPED